MEPQVMRSGDRLASKVLLVGWDAADWKFITPLLDRGLMPTLDGLINRGVMGNIATLRPIYSPMIWNSIATGKTPDKHGILSFIEPDPVTGGARPVTSTSRKVKAVWNILHQSGLRSGVVSWFAGHPAEPVNGTVVSPYFQLAGRNPETWGPPPDGSIHPPELAETFTGLRVHPMDLAAAALLPFIPRAAEIDQQKDGRLSFLARTLAECCSVHNAATWIMEHREWDFMAVYYDAIDHAGHGFAPYHPPRMDGVPERDFEIYKDVMSGFYRFHDMMLERLLDLAGPDTIVILLSDHGFHSDHLRPRLPLPTHDDPARWHRDQGILCMAGPGIRQDERIYGASVLDITPTVLNLFGLPVGDDMDGKVLVQAYEQVPAMTRIPSWEQVDGDCGQHTEAQRMDAAASQALIEQFVALGYVEPPSAEQSKMAERAVDQANFNLARVYLATRRPHLAVPVLEALLTKSDAPHYRAALAHCYLRLRRGDEARTMIAPLLKETPGQHAATEWLHAITSAQRSKPEEALAHVVRMKEATPDVTAVQVRAGMAFLLYRRWEDARRSFQDGLDLDRDNVPAHLGLALALLRLKDDGGAAREALEAVGLEHALPLGHCLLGVALARLGHFDRASLALDTALAFQPGMAVALRWLVRIHGRPGGDPARAALYRERLRQLRDRVAAARVG
jgi:tetratricopeptide (TPR) repeat protein